MSLTVGITVLLVIVAIIVALVLYLTLNPGSAVGVSAQSAVSNNLRALVVAQRTRPGEEKKTRDKKSNLALAAAAESELSRKKSASSSRLTLEKRLKYAHWVITPAQFRAIQALVAVAVFIPAYLHATIFILILVVVMSPLLVSAVLDYCVQRRFNLFDEDYPVLLMQYVSLLKTGLSPITGLEAAAEGLDEGSLVRSEVLLLIERLHLGLTEEQAISAFGEDIPHPELELFVQSLLLSRRVGGTLSATLERLARQVRKRQQFRKQAVAAVSMERSSLMMIAIIMGLLMFYLAWSAPELVFPTFRSSLGNKIFQFGLMCIVFGFYWSRKVTNIKV